MIRAAIWLLFSFATNARIMKLLTTGYSCIRGKKYKNNPLYYIKMASQALLHIFIA